MTGESGSASLSGIGGGDGGSGSGSRGSSLEEDEFSHESGSASLATFGTTTVVTSTDNQLQPNTHNNNQEEEDLSNRSPIVKPKKKKKNDVNGKMLHDDMGDYNGDSDDGSVYRRPKSPTFDINPDDEVSFRRKKI